MLGFLRKTHASSMKKALNVVLIWPVLLPVRLGQRAHAPAFGRSVSSCGSNGAFVRSRWISRSIHALAPAPWSPRPSFLSGWPLTEIRERRPMVSSPSGNDHCASRDGHAVVESHAVGVVFADQLCGAFRDHDLGATLLCLGRRRVRPALALKSPLEIQGSSRFSSSSPLVLQASSPR
jgi:hypothetical protein